MIKFFVRGPLPGLNEIIQACKTEIKRLRKGKRRCYQITLMKEEWTERVATYFKDQIGTPKQPLDRPIAVLCEWIEPNNRRDPDNVFAGQKFILDGLVKAGLIQNDTRKWIAGVDHKLLENVPESPGVIVTISIK